MVDRKKIIKIFKACPTPTSIVKADPPHFTFIQVNDAYVEMTQKSESELLGKSLFEAFPENPDEEKPTGVEKLRNSFLKVIESKSKDEMYGIRYDIVLDDGEYKQLYWKVVNTPVLDEKGEVEFIINSATNITEKYRSDLEKKLMLNNSEDSFILIDKNLKILNFNDQFAENYFDIFNKKIKKGDSILDYAQPERREIVKGIYGRVFEGETISNELTVPAVGGESRHFTIKYKPAKDENEKIIGSFISLIEITSEKNAWDQLEENEARFRALVEKGNDILFLLDKNASPFYSSPSVKHILGYTAEEIAEMDILEVSHPDDVSIIQGKIEECLGKPSEAIEVSPVRLNDKDGNWHWFEGTITNMIHDPAIDGIVNNFKEVTERVEAETSRDHSLQQLAERVKEQRCLYEISKLKERELTIDELLEKAIQLIPEAWQFPEFAEVCINWDGKSYKTEDYRKTDWELKKSFDHLSDKEFQISIIYTSNESFGDSTPFLNEEHDLLRAVGEQITTKIQQIISRKEKEFERLNNQALINSTQELIWSIDTEYKLITGNQGFLNTIEFQTGQSIDTGDSIFQGISSDDEYIKKWKNFYKRALNGETFTIENEEPHPEDNSNIWYEIAFNPIIKDDNITGVACFAHNITETKQAQLEKQKAEKKYRNVVEHSTNMFYQHDTEGVLNYVSPQSIDFLGYPPEQAMRHWTEFITDHPINSKGEKHTQKALETGEIQPPYELQLRTADDRIIWVEIHEAPLIEDGKVTGIVGSLSDITERKKYEEQLQESLERYNYASKATRDAIYDWDIINDSLHWGEGFQKIFGHKPGEGKYPIEKYHQSVHPEDREEAFDDLKFTLNDSSMNKWSFEYRFQKSDGQYAYVLENGYIIRDEDGKATRMIGAIRDITEEKQTEIQTKLQHQVAYFFKEENRLNPILDDLLVYLATFEKFNLAEIWLVSKSKSHLNLNSTFARDNIGNTFYRNSDSVDIAGFGEGLPGIAWKNNSIETWDDLPHSSSFIRNEAAKKAGLKSASALPLYYKEEIVGVLVLGSQDTATSIHDKIHPYEILQDFLGAEIRRKQQEEEMFLLFKSSPDILAITAPNKQFVRVNPAFCEIMGYTEKELTTQSYENFVHPDDLGDTKKEYEQTISGQRKADGYINRWITKSGEVRYISWSSSEVFGEDGFVFSFGRDVTDRLELENLLNQVQRMAKIGGWEVDFQNNELYWSPITKEIHEVPSDYKPNIENALQFYKEGESRESINQVLNEAIENGKPWDVELQIITAKGNEKWIRAKGEPEIINGKCVRLYGSFQNITEKKTVEIELEKAFKEKDAILESIKDAFFAVDENWTVTYWNKEAENVLFKSREEIIGRNLWVEYEDAKELEFFKQYHKAVDEQVTVNFEEYYPAVEKWFEVSAYPSENGLSVYFKDITERRKAVLELQEAYKEKENILESIGDGFFTLDEEWNVTYWNRTAEQLLHTPKHEILNQNLWDVFTDAIDLPSYTNYHRVMYEQKPITFEDYYEPIDKWFDISAYPSSDGISVFFKDITERKKARQQLEELNKELESRAQELAASNAELEQFAYVASHDLQEPLRMVTSFLTQLEKKYDDQLDEKASQYIHFAVDGAQRMRQIILDLLNYSRLNQEKNKREDVDLNAIIEDVKALERSHINESNAEIIVDKLPTISASPGPIKQVFQNLINNALKYQDPENKPIVNIHFDETETHWKFSVKDNGIGINEEFQDTIFQIFQRLHTRDQYSGTGIGLSISRKIIERHGGEIWLESEEGKGSIFYFTISKE